MNNEEINRALLNADVSSAGVLPHLDNLKSVEFVFDYSFGLNVLPLEPGVILVRGPRQYGKSTWLEQQIHQTILQFGQGSALYINGDEMTDFKALGQTVKTLAMLFHPAAKVKRLFIDEITAVANWQQAIKRLIDGGILKEILLVTTGSKAADLRRGVERLPGRKGKLDRTNYIFTPIGYRSFKNKCADIFKADTLFAYILSGGSPIAANAIASTQRLPDYVVAIASDWILGEFSASGRSRAHLLAVLQSLYRFAPAPIGQAKLARESGLANNTIAQGYIDLLSDLLTVMPAFSYDVERKITLFRKPCKYHFVNLLVALTWHPKKPRTVSELKQLGNDLGTVFEWLVAQELWRRFCIANTQELPENLCFWQSKEHEIDFVLPEQQNYLEVKAGGCYPTDFMWFLKNFNRANLTVINQNRFITERINGITLEDFLLSDQPQK